MASRTSRAASELFLQLHDHSAHVVTTIRADHVRGTHGAALWAILQLFRFERVVRAAFARSRIGMFSFRNGHDNTRIRFLSEITISTVARGVGRQRPTAARVAVYASDESFMVDSAQYRVNGMKPVPAMEQTAVVSAFRDHISRHFRAEHVERGFADR